MEEQPPPQRMSRNEFEQRLGATGSTGGGTETPVTSSAPQKERTSGLQTVPGQELTSRTDYVGQFNYGKELESARAALKREAGDILNRRSTLLTLTQEAGGDEDLARSVLAELKRETLIERARKIADTTGQKVDEDKVPDGASVEQIAQALREALAEQKAEEEKAKQTGIAGKAKDVADKAGGQLMSRVINKVIDLAIGGAVAGTVSEKLDEAEDRKEHQEEKAEKKRGGLDPADMANVIALHKLGFSPDEIVATYQGADRSEQDQMLARALAERLQRGQQQEPEKPAEPEPKDKPKPEEQNKKPTVEQLRERFHNLSYADLRLQLADESDTELAKLLKEEKLNRAREIHNGRYADLSQKALERRIREVLKVSDIDSVDGNLNDLAEVLDDEAVAVNGYANNRRWNGAVYDIIRGELDQVRLEIYINMSNEELATRGLDREKLRSDLEALKKTRLGLVTVRAPNGILQEEVSEEELADFYKRQVPGADNVYRRRLEERRIREETEKRRREAAPVSPPPPPDGNRRPRGGGNEDEGGPIAEMEHDAMRERLFFRLKYSSGVKMDQYEAWLNTHTSANTPDLALLKGLHYLNEDVIRKKGASSRNETAEALNVNIAIDRAHYIELWKMEGSQQARNMIMELVGLDMEAMVRDGVKMEDVWKRTVRPHTVIRDEYSRDGNLTSLRTVTENKVVDLRDYVKKTPYTDKDGVRRCLYGNQIVLENGTPLTKQDGNVDVPVSLITMQDRDKEPYWNAIIKRVGQEQHVDDPKKAEEIAIVAMMTLKHMGAFEMMADRVANNHPFLDTTTFNTIRYRESIVFRTLNFDFLAKSAHNDLLKAISNNRVPGIDLDTVLANRNGSDLTVRNLLIAPDVFLPLAVNQGTYKGGLLQSVVDNNLDSGNFGSGIIFEDVGKNASAAEALNKLQLEPSPDHRGSVKTEWAFTVNQLVLLRAKELVFVSRSATMEDLITKANGDPYIRKTVDDLTVFYTSRQLAFRLEAAGRNIILSSQNIGDKGENAGVYATTAYVWARQAEALTFDGALEAYLSDPNNVRPLKSEWGRHMMQLLRQNDGDVMGILEAVAAGDQTPYNWNEDRNGIREDKRNKYFARWKNNRNGSVEAQEALRRYVSERGLMRNLINVPIGGLGLGDQTVWAWYEENRAWELKKQSLRQLHDKDSGNWKNSEFARILAL